VKCREGEAVFFSSNELELMDAVVEQLNERDGPGWTRRDVVVRALRALVAPSPEERKRQVEGRASVLHRVACRVAQKVGEREEHWPVYTYTSPSGMRVRYKVGVEKSLVIGMGGEMLEVTVQVSGGQRVVVLRAGDQGVVHHMSRLSGDWTRELEALWVEHWPGEPLPVVGEVQDLE
jgi:hypothetical protein